MLVANELQATLANTDECKELKKFGLDCPLCGRDHHCFGNQDLSFVICGKTDVAPDGYKSVGLGKDGRNMFRKIEKKAPRLDGTEEYVYTDNQGYETIKVQVRRPGSIDKDGKYKDKDVLQLYKWGDDWFFGGKVPKEVKAKSRGKTTWYRYLDIKKAIEAGEPIFIVEGEGVAEALWRLGLAATTTIGGSTNYRNCSPDLKKDLEGADTIILCPDRDQPGLKYMQQINEDFEDAKWVYSPPSDFYWSERGLPPKDGLDIKDWILHGATVEDIMGAIQERQIVVDSLNRAVNSPDGVGTSARSENKRLQNLIQVKWGERLRFNEMTVQPELDGKPMELDMLSMKIADEWDIDVSDEKALKAVIFVAKKNRYHPVRDYLNTVAKQYPDTPETRDLLNTMGLRYFGSTEPLHNDFVSKTLIGAVARVFDPGCKHDTVLTLQGGQGKLKSTLFEKLAVDKDWFDDTISSSNSSDKDERLKLRRFWMLELAEIEAVFKRKEVPGLRAFFTTKIDNLRPPYSRSVEAFPRTSIFVATVNPDEFLCDPEGHRRYWVVPVMVDRIPVELVEKERDILWAAAVHAYRRGEKSYLSPEQEKRNAFLNKQYEVTDSWQEIIEFYLENRKEITVSQILSDCLNIEVGRHDKPCQMRASQILKTLGWRKKPKKQKIDGKSVFVWAQPNETEIIAIVATDIEVGGNQNQGGGNQVATEVATDPNKSTARDIEKELPPLIKNEEEKLEEKIEIENTSNVETHGNLKSSGNQEVATIAEIFMQQEEKEKNTQVATFDFDAVGNAEIMVACLDVPNGGAFLLNLCQSWSNEQKAAVRQHMTVEQVNHARQLMRDVLQAKEPPAPVEPESIQPDTQKKIEPGARVRYVGDDAKLQENYRDAELIVHSVVGGRQADCQVVKNGEIIAYTSWFFLGASSDEKCELKLCNET